MPLPWEQRKIRSMRRTCCRCRPDTAMQNLEKPRPTNPGFLLALMRAHPNMSGNDLTYQEHQDSAPYDKSVAAMCPKLRTSFERNGKPRDPRGPWRRRGLRSRRLPSTPLQRTWQTGPVRRQRKGSNGWMLQERLSIFPLPFFTELLLLVLRKKRPS